MEVRKRRNIGRIVALILTAPIVLFAALITLLYLPPVQDWAIEKVAVLTSESTKMDVRVGKVRLAFPLDFSLMDVVVCNHVGGDTLASLGELRGGISVWPLLRGQVEMRHIILNQVQLHTQQMIPSVGIDGRIEKVRLDGCDVNFLAEKVNAENLFLHDADIKLILRSNRGMSEKKFSSTNWNFFLGSVKISQMKFQLQKPADTLSLSAGWQMMESDNLAIDLSTASYGLHRINLTEGNVAYDVTHCTPLNGFDPKHVGLRNVNLLLDSVSYSAQNMLATIRQLSLDERSGIRLIRTEGQMQIDNAGMNLPHLLIETGSSLVQANGKLPWSALKGGGKEQMHLFLQGYVGQTDIRTFSGGRVLHNISPNTPSSPLRLYAKAHGNTEEWKIDSLRLHMDSVVTIGARGNLQHLADDNLRMGSVNLWAQTYDQEILSLSPYSPHVGRWNIPLRMNVEASLRAEKALYDIDLKLHQQGGGASLKASYDTSSQAYHLQAHADSLNLIHFLPHDSLMHLSARANINGRGTDIYAFTTQFLADACIDHLRYKDWDISNVRMNGSLEGHQMCVALNSHNPLLEMKSSIKALMRADSLSVQADMEVEKVDLCLLRMTKNPLEMSLHVQTEGETNWKNFHVAQGCVDHMKLKTIQGEFTPKDLKFFALTRPDTLSLQLKAGDLDMEANGDEGVELFACRIRDFTQELMSQTRTRTLNFEKIKSRLPQVHFSLNTGKDNPIVNYLQYSSGISLKQMEVDLSVSPYQGIEGDAFIYRLRSDSIEFDTVKMEVSMVKDTALVANLTVSNAPNARKPVFTTYVNSAISEKESYVHLQFLNEKGEIGLNLGLQAQQEKEEILLSFFPEHPIIGFRPFTLNKDNHVAFSDSGKVEAHVEMIDKYGTGIRLYSTPNEEAEQDLTIDFTRLNLSEIVATLPYLPDISGVMDAEFHYLNSLEESNTFSGILRTEKLTYNGYPMGDQELEAVYLPTMEGKHLVNMQWMVNDEVVATIDGSYWNENSSPQEGQLSVDVNLDKIPLDVVNAFMPNEVVNVSGAFSGVLTAKGNISAPRIDGEVRFDSTMVHSPLYAVDFSIDRNPIRIVQNKLSLEKFNIYSKGKNPFTLTGNIDFSDFSHIESDLHMSAEEYELLNAKRNNHSVLYGKVIVSLSSTIRGKLSNPTMRGHMNILGTTDVTYILKKSPLMVEDRLGSMVTFVNLNDTISPPLKDKEISIGGMDLLLNVQIDPGAQIQADLGGDNYVRVQGGGNLSMQYTPQGDLLLTGRYTLDSGEMKYSIPVIPLKTFNIAQGSYVDFTGNLANPHLNITATERVRTSVTEDNNSRYVNFDVGITITQTLENMGLTFTLDAPEDITLQNQLIAMSPEERGKLAVTMLVTGMYMGGQGGNEKGFNTNNALNSFLQNEISNIAGSALKTVDVSIGVEDNYATDGTASGGTDYSFRFAKRFWDNRLSVIIGGRISTGNEAKVEENESFIDDISLEWRLDKSGTRYVKLFHTKNYESILEGEIVETGVGLVLRRKVDKLGELFIFRRK